VNLPGDGSRDEGLAVFFKQLNAALQPLNDLYVRVSHFDECSKERRLL
jgi:hypothetical protein